MEKYCFMQGQGDCLILFGVCAEGCRLLLISLGCLGYGGGGGGFWTILDDSSRDATEKAKLVVKIVLTFLRCQLTISVKAGEGFQLSMMNHIILDTFHKTVVCLQTVLHLPT